MAEDQQSEIIVVGARPRPLRDFYHAVLRLSWPATLALLAGGYLTANVVFALLYWELDGVANMRRGFLDAFFFSVQTMGTIGYGAMYPTSVAANLLVVTESVVGLVITALATGLLFAKFSLSGSRLVFTRQVAISPWNKVPTLSFRVGNDRSSTIVDATLRVALVRTERTEEGVLFYKMYDLKLVRDRSPAVSRSWNVMHTIDEESPLFGYDPEKLAACEAELIVTVVGTDDTSLQPVHGRHRYLHTDVVFGARHADILSELPDGRIQLDIRRFHDLEPTQKTADFPYSQGS